VVINSKRMKGARRVAHVGNEIPRRLCLKNLRERQSGDLDINGRIILKHILKEVDCDNMNWTEDLRIGLMVDFYGE
jgi:hypothetical protein